MSESKEVSVVSSNTELNSIVSKDITFNKQDVDPFLVAIPGSASILVLAAGIAGGITTGDITNPLMAVLATGLMTGASGMVLLVEKFSKISSTFFPDGVTQLTMKTRWKAKTERILVNTIHIKEKVDVSVTQWQDPKNAVPEHEATHTVTQYLRKTRKGYQVEQEITPNNEAIWDMSADALVEVYSVQEKTDSVKEVTA